MAKKKILFCKTGWMKRYQGPTPNNLEDDPYPIGGGSYNKDHIGYEVFNFLPHNGNYYGFVQINEKKQKTSGSIAIENLGADTTDNKIDDVLVVWTATNPKTRGIDIVGWYKHATVFRDLQDDLKIPERRITDKDNTQKYCNQYRITSQDAVLVDEKARSQVITKFRSIFYDANNTITQTVLSYINQYEAKLDAISQTEETLEKLMAGFDREAKGRVRVNQGKFRDGLLAHPRCCLCGVDDPRFLIASHIKPWSVSNGTEKTDLANGFLMCPNHDCLFDSGYISFCDNGEIMISSQVSKNNLGYLNIKPGMKIQISAANRKYLKYHRDNIFKK